MLKRLQQAVCFMAVCVALQWAYGVQGSGPTGPQAFAVSAAEFAAHSVQTPSAGDRGRYVGGQDVRQGVLALNSDQDIYRPGDTAIVAIAVLDKEGMMVCDADLQLAVVHRQTGENMTFSTADGSISVNPECHVKAYTARPDFVARVNLADPGQYEMRLQAGFRGQVRRVSEYIVVADQPEYEIRRSAPTRIFPLANYPVRITVTASKDFKGVLRETVPSGFQIFEAPGSLNGPANAAGQKTVTLLSTGFGQGTASHVDEGPRTILYPVDLKAGESQTFSYTFYAPSLSPELFALGPLQLSDEDQTVHEESRRWWIASDAASTLRPNGDGSTGSYTQAGETAAFWDSIDDDPDSSDGDTSYVQSPPRANGSMFVLLSDTPADFTTMDSIEIKARHRESGTGNDTCTVFYQIFQSNESTTITGETSGTLLGTTYSTNAYTVTDSGQNKATWDGARLRIRNNYQKNGGFDDAPCRVTAVEVNITYTPPAGFTIGGTSDLASGTVFLAYNSTLQSGDTGSIAGGSWTITPASAPNSGDVVTVWVDNVADSSETTAVTKYDGTGNITGLVLNANSLSIGSVDNQSLTVTNLGQYDADQDEDIMHTANGGTLRVEAAGNSYTDETIDILANNTLTISGSETLDTHNLTINGTLVSSGAGTFNVSGSWDNNNEFHSGSETITFTSTGSETIDSTLAADVDVHSVTFNGSGGTWTLESALDVNGSLVITAGTLDTKLGEDNAITVGGNWDNNATFTARSGLVTFDGSSAQTVSAGASNFNDITVSNASASGVTFDEAFSVVDFTNITPGSVMKFQQSTTFTVTGSMVWEGSSANEVVVDSVDGATRFTINSTGGNQLLREVQAANANASSNNIKVLNGTNGGNTDADETSPFWIFKAEDCLVANADGSTGSYTQFGETAAFWDSIDESVTSNDGDTSYVQSAVQADGSMFVQLTDTGALFTNADSIRISAAHREAGAGNDTCSVFYQVYQSNETTAISAETAATLLPQQAAFQQNVYNLSGTADNKTVWDAARLRIRNNYTKSGPSDDAPCRVSAVEVCVEYTPALIDISGTCQQADQSTDCTDTGTVRVAVNGALQAETQPTVAGTWTILNVPGPLAGDTITVFIDGAADNREAVAVTKYDGAGDITGVQLFEEKLTLGSNDTPATISNADLSLYDNSASGDEDIFHDVDGANDLTVDVTGNLTQEELLIRSGWTFRPDSASSGNVSTHDIENNGTIIADGNAFSFDGDWVGGTGSVFTGTQSVLLNQASGTQTLTGSLSFYNFEIADPDGGGDLNVIPSGTLDINGTFLLTDGNFDLATNDPDMFVAGNFTLVSGSFTPGLKAITFDGDKIFTDNIVTNVGTLIIDPTTTLGSDMTCSSLTVNSGDTLVTDGYEIDCSNDITINGTLDARPGTDGNTTINVGRNWDSGSGLLMMVSSTLIMDDTSGNSDFTSGSNTFYNLTFDDGNGGGNVTWNLQDDLAVDGTLSIIEGALDVTTSNHGITVNGNWFNSDTFVERSGTVTVAGTMAQTITTCSGCASGDFNNLVVTNNSAIVAFEDSFSVANFTATTADTSMTFEAGTTVTISGNLNLNGGAVGDEIILNSSDGATRFTFDVTGGAQNVRYVDVSNSQSSTNDITATNSKRGANTDATEQSPHWTFRPLRGAIIIVD